MAEITAGSHPAGQLRLHAVLTTTRLARLLPLLNLLKRLLDGFNLSLFS